MPDHHDYQVSGGTPPSNQMLVKLNPSLFNFAWSPSNLNRKLFNFLRELFNFQRRTFNFWHLAFNFRRGACYFRRGACNF